MRSRHGWPQAHLAPPRCAPPATWHWSPRATPVTEATRRMEIVVDGAIAPALDPALGLHIRISTVGGLVVNSTFVFQVMLAAGGTAGDVDEAFDAADCFVRTVPLDQLVEANESPEPPAPVITAIDRAVAECRVR